jgi:DNA-binding MarR family transcriptional regulator
MKFKVADARRVLSFCLDRTYDFQVSDEGTHKSLRITPPDDSPVQVYQGDTFEEALRAAAQAGVVRSACIERQIAFTLGSLERTFDAKAGQWSGPALPSTAELAAEVPARAGQELGMAHYRGLAEFRYQIRKFLSFSEGAARRAGLEPAQHQLLLAIHGLPPGKRPTLATLAERMCTDLEGCEALARVLLERELIQRGVSPHDRREQLLLLTETGLALLRDLTVQHRNQILAVGPTFVQALGAILCAFEEAD